MKKLLIFTSLSVVMATSMFGQGLFLSNLGNTGGPSATSSGLIYLFPDQLADLYNNDLGAEISAGLTSVSLSPLGLGTYTAATDPKGYTAWNLGQFYLGAVSAETLIPGAAAGDMAWIQMNMWLDGPYGLPVLFNSYAAALSSGGITATVLFQQQLGGGGLPPAPPTGFTMMPSVVFLPEPSAYTLMGLGVGALWLLRRRK